MPNSSKRAFTIVELLVSIGIVAVITGAMLANFRGGQHASELRFAAEITVNAFREVQTSALAGRLASICSGGTENLQVCEPGKTPAVGCSGGACQRRVPSGYGIRLSAAEPKTYLLFFDTDGDGLYDPGEEFTRQSLVSTANVVFDSASVPTPLDIVFRPPAGAMLINGAPAPDSVIITLRHELKDTIRHVNLFRISGKIEHD
jgi:type II secretory pathway pseudopilin PulG